MQETVIKLEHITREFPGVLANDDVSLEIHRGEVFALVGENGACLLYTSPSPRD